MQQPPLKIHMKAPGDLKTYQNNPRQNQNTILKLQDAIKRFGFLIPIILDKNDTIICGHARHAAALKLNLPQIPCIYAQHLTPAQIKAFRIADNKTAEISLWDYQKLCDEIIALYNNQFDLDATGFDALEQEYYTGISVQKNTKSITSKNDPIHHEKPSEQIQITILCQSEEDKDFLAQLFNEPGDLKNSYTLSQIITYRQDGDNSPPPALQN